MRLQDDTRLAMSILLMNLYFSTGGPCPTEVAHGESDLIAPGTP